MSAPIKQDAAFRWTENGQSYLHYLGAKIRRPVANPVQQVHEHWSADLTSVRAVAIGSGVSDLSGTLRFDGNPESLEQFIAAGRRKAALEYFPSLANPSLSFPCVMVSAGEIQTDPDLWFDNRYQVDVRFRRIDGGSWKALLEEPLFYWRAGTRAHGFAFDRAGPASYEDEFGVLRSAAEDIARHTWSEVDGVLRPALRMERAGTNRLQRTEDLDHAYWQQFDSVTPDQRVGPDGVQSLDAIIDSATDTVHGLATASPVTVTASVDHCLSGWFIAGDVDWVVLGVSNGVNVARQWFNLATGAVGGTVLFVYGVVRAYIEDWTDVVPGLYRCVAAFDAGVGTTLSVEVFSATADQDTAYAGAGTAAIYAGYLQFEDGTRVASSYSRATTAAFTRGAEYWRATYEHAPQAATLYARFRELSEPNWSLAGGATPRVVNIGNAAGTGSRLFLNKNGTVQYGFGMRNGAVDMSQRLISLSPVRRDIIELRGVLFGDGSGLLGGSRNGEAEVVTAQSAAVGLPPEWADTLIALGSLGASLGQGDVELLDVKLQPDERSMDYMRAL
jgi:hypothetical protein